MSPRTPEMPEIKRKYKSEPHRVRFQPGGRPMETDQADAGRQNKAAVGRRCQKTVMLWYEWRVSPRQVQPEQPTGLAIVHFHGNRAS
ncbi:hypothetical protein N7492_000448 [Penicillium capsulatum]|uniref:Uncharacterized protein n=1 Tax=Penicillium capsulatum TaxID=69766 RepID=A0A9W9IRV9_9EURO|nr:hypothetical protein N7492_000448 [Penicillium capsulatum]